MKNLKRLGVMLLAAAMATSIVGCGGARGRGNSNANTKVTTIEFCNFLGCSGDEWIKQAASRFSDLKTDESYEEGKTGVEVKVVQEKQIPYDNVDQSGYDIFVGENKVDAYAMSKQGFLMDLSDIITSLEGRISSTVLSGLKGYDDKYYSLPHYAWYTGVSYDVSYFESANLYFAAADSKPGFYREVKNAFGSAKLVNSMVSTKSCGPNGVSGDYDDGLPSSLEEYLILCEEIKTQAGRTPFELGGASIDYAFFLVDGLWASIAGPKQIQTIYSLDSKGELVDLVKLDENGNIVYTEEVFYTTTSGEVIKKPEIVQEPITEQTGYRIYDMVSRYYAMAFLRIALDRGWINDVSDPGVSNIKAQERFLINKKTAMLYDASYWYSESVAWDNIEKYETMYPGMGKPKVSYMPLPTQLEGQVTEGKGDKQALLDVGASQIFVNKRVESNPGKKRAVTEFLQFLYSDEELAAFTELTGYVRPIEYDYDNSTLDYYFSTLSEIVEDSQVIYYAAESNIFKKAKMNFSLTWSGPANIATIGHTQVMQGFLVAMKSYGGSVHDIFNTTRKTKSGWQSYLEYLN